MNNRDAMTIARVAQLGLVCIMATASALAQGVIPAPLGQATGRPVAISVDLAKPLGEYKPIYSWFGYDEGNYTTGRNGKVLLRELHDLSPVPVYIRAHHLLTSGDGTPDLKWSSTNVYTEDGNGKPIYDFKILDGIFDEYLPVGWIGIAKRLLNVVQILLEPTSPNAHFDECVAAGGFHQCIEEFPVCGERVRQLVEPVRTAHPAPLANIGIRVLNEDDVGHPSAMVATRFAESRTRK